MLEKGLKQSVKILSVETSCDETGVSIIEASGSAKNPCFQVLGNALYSQIDTHSEYGGVFPMLAKREHTLNLVPLLKSATEHAAKNGTRTARVSVTAELESKILELLTRENDLGPALVEFLKTHDVPEVDHVAVTEGPGLEPALWVGISFAKALALALGKPLTPVNHMEGHIVSVLIDGQSGSSSEISHVEFPALALLISGGHTELVLCNSWHDYSVIGQTVDDAIGEAFDKVARLIGLPYPGGPKISKLAAESRAQNLKLANAADSWSLPRPMLKSPDFNFSFSGLKTAVRYAVQDRLAQRAARVSNAAGVTTVTDIEDAGDSKPKLTDIEKALLAEEFENAVTEVLIHKTKRAVEETGARTLIIGGGVIANTYIREAFAKLAEHTGVQLFTPSVSLSTDNSIMIGIAAYLKIISGKFEPLTAEKGLAELKALGNLSL